MTSDEDDLCTHPNGFGIYGCPCGMTREQYEQETEDQMSGVHQRTKTVTQYEVVVPAKEPQGACWNDVRRGMTMIQRTWREVTANRSLNYSIPDDAIHVHASDENGGQIVFSFTVGKDQ